MFALAEVMFTDHNDCVQL